MYAATVPVTTARAFVGRRAALQLANPETPSLIDVAGLAAELRRLALPSRLMVGIAGQPGSGKSVLVEALTAQLEGEVAVVQADGFRLATAVISRDERKLRRGAPDTFDLAGYESLLSRLRRNRDDVIYAPRFSAELDDPVAGAIPIPAETRIVLTVGNHLLHRRWRDARRWLDEVWYLEGPGDEPGSEGGDRPDRVLRWSS